MKPLNLKTLNTLFSLLTEEELSTDFGKFKLKHKLILIKQLSNRDETTTAVVDYLLNSALTDAFFIHADNQIFLNAYYSPTEIQDINLILGLHETNLVLSENLLDNIYNKNHDATKVQELYYQLKSKHFKPPKYYLDNRYQGVTDVADRLQYEREASK
jgi:hypothetical protein